MGDPKKIRRKYSGPNHPWEKSRIEEEKILKKEYALKNKKEIWKMVSKLKNFKYQVKTLSAGTGQQAEKEKQQLLQKLNSLGILAQGASMDEVLGLDVRSIMERRLQSVLCKKGLARSMKQARQFIVHNHVSVNGIKITSPSYLVRTGEEVTFSESSALKEEMHPERVEKKPEKDKIEKKVTVEKEEEVLAYKKEEILNEDEIALAEVKKKAKEVEETPAKTPEQKTPEKPEEQKASAEKPAKEEKNG